MDSANDDAKGAGYRRVEVLTGPGRRRSWSDDEKARIVAETAEPGAKVTEVAHRWQVSLQQVFDWRRQARRAAPVRQRSSIEVKLAGAVLHIAPGTDEALLTTVLRAIRGSAA
jgi:transposase